mgnify:FL=1
MERVTFLIGGASSGKSDLAERWAVSTGLPCRYIATAEAQDAEMASKIEAHQKNRGEGWQVVEAPLALAEALPAADHDGVTLLDGITLWLSNIMHAEADIAPRIDAFLGTIERARGPLIIVSDEVGMGVVPDTRLGRRYRDALGKLNQQIAARSDCVVGVMAGLPFVLKGKLPDA